MTRSAVVHVCRWWPAAALITLSVVAQKIFVESRYDVSGHAAEHLSSAGVAFAAFALAGILLYATPGGRRRPVVVGTVAVWLLTTVLVLVGNLRVVDALVRAGLADTPTSELVQDTTIESAHDLANLAPFLGVVAAIALTWVFWRCRHISGRVTVSATVLSVIFPPWIFPGAGVLVVIVARCVAYHRAARTDRRPSIVSTIGEVV